MENTELINKAINYAKGNFSNTDITAGRVAEQAGFSIDYFNRIFLSHTGFTVMAYVNYIRIKNAMRLLRTTEMTVLDIALSVGFDSHEGFIKAFKKVYDIAPAEYRKRNADKVLYYGELTDAAFANRFIHENVDFQLVNNDDVIDFLLEKDACRYGYVCTLIKYMGFAVAAPDGKYKDGFVCICDDRSGGYFLEAVTDDFNLLVKWLSRFGELKSFYYNEQPNILLPMLKSEGFSKEIAFTPHALYLSSEAVHNDLPQGMEIRELTPSDKDSILQWANGKDDGYIRHLLNEKHYLDPSVLEYGVFRCGRLIAVAGCGIDEVHGLRLNNCCSIRFADGEQRDELYRKIYESVTSRIVDKGVIPFDDLQHGAYAQSHGGFTSEDIGFTTVNWCYKI